MLPCKSFKNTLYLDTLRQKYIIEKQFMFGIFIKCFPFNSQSIVFILISPEPRLQFYYPYSSLIKRRKSNYICSKIALSDISIFFYFYDSINKDQIKSFYFGISIIVMALLFGYHFFFLFLFHIEKSI